MLESYFIEIFWESLRQVVKIMWFGFEESELDSMQVDFKMFFVCEIYFLFSIV